MQYLLLATGGGNSICITQLTGRDQVDVIYTNDYNGGEGDRDLFVDNVIVNGTTFQAEGAMAIDRGSGNAAFDGADVIPGQEELDLNGALRMVRGSGGNAYGYDQNGNRSYWLKEGQAHVYTHDAENRLVEVKQNGALLMSFTYDGDGQRVKSTLVGSPSNTVAYYIGNHTEFEIVGQTTTLRRYFYAGSTRVAMRVVDGATNPTYWLLNDHLGSTAITADASGALSAELRFKAWGEQRYASGSTPTTYRYTGQREQSQLSIYFYGARWYDPDLSRFLSPDSIIPGAGNSQAWDRFAYALNSPIRFVDPTGHAAGVALIAGDADFTGNQLYGISFKNTKGKWSLKNMLSVLDGAKKVGQKLSKYLGGSAADAFRKTYGIQGSTRVTLEWDTDCPECRPSGCGSDFSSPGCKPAFGATIGARHIKFASMSSRDLSRENNAIHEFMHAFENVIIQTGPNGKPYKPARNALPNDLWTTREGLAGAPYQQSGDLTDGEMFADMGIGWVQGVWGTSEDGRISSMGATRRDWMNVNMPIFINMIP